MRHGGLGLSLLLALSCACSSSSVTPAGGEHAGGEGGTTTNGGEPWTDGRFVGAETGDAGAPSDDGDVVECEAAPGVPLTRPGCPEQAPHASDCPHEGLRCLYAGAADGCYVEWECLLGLWSPHDESCRADTAADPENDAACSSYVPVSGEPCAGPGEGIRCRYGPCDIGGYVQVEVTCECFRSVVASNGCPTVP